MPLNTAFCRLRNLAKTLQEGEVDPALHHPLLPADHGDAVLHPHIRQHLPLHELQRVDVLEGLVAIRGVRDALPLNLLQTVLVHQMQVATTIGKQEEGAVVQHDGGCAPPLLRARLEGEGARKLERRPLQAVEQTRLLSPRQRDESVVVERNALPLASQNHASLTKYRARKRFP